MRRLAKWLLSNAEEEVVGAGKRFRKMRMVERHLAEVLHSSAFGHFPSLRRFS